MARKDFYSFVDEKIYDRVSARRDKLLRRLSAGEKPRILHGELTASSVQQQER